MLSAELNFRLLQEMEANRRFLLRAYRSNPELLAGAEECVRQALADDLVESEMPRVPPHRRPAETDFSG